MISDFATWVKPAKLVCLSILEVKRGLRYFSNEYFQDKKIIISGIFADEFKLKYSNLLKEISSTFDRRFILTTADCATYGSMSQQERNTEIESMLEQNKIIFSRYPDQKFIGILAGYTKEEYQWTYEELKPYCDSFLIYLTGYIRANPRWFDLPKLLNEILPNGIKEPVFCYGYNNASLKYLSKIKKKWNLQFAITESYRMEAIYHGGYQYSRKVKMQKAWEKKRKIFGYY